MSIAVEFDRVSIVFGEDPKSALPLMDQGQSWSLWACRDLENRPYCAGLMR